MNQEARTTGFEIGVARQPLPGESLCGDAHWVKRLDDAMLIAVMDGGTGAATTATGAAMRLLEKHATEPLAKLVERCRQVLARSPGAALTLLSVRPQNRSVTWLGMGNVWATLLRRGVAAENQFTAVPLRGGVVGYHLPQSCSGEVAIAMGDWLVVATAGVRAEFELRISADQISTQVAQEILTRHTKGDGDALVVAACYRGDHDE